MFNSWKAAGLALVVLTSAAMAGIAPARADDAADRAAINDVWNKYQDYVVLKKGKEAVALLAKPTIKYYGDMRQAILTGTPKAVAKMGVLTRLSIYMIRHLVTAAKLKPMTPRAFLAWTIDRGMTSAGGRRIKLRDLTITGDTAIGYVGQGKGQGAPAFKFHRESGAWKLDYTEVVRRMEPLMEKRLKKQGITDDKIVALMVRRFTKKPIDFEKLKQPLIRQN
jgi:hypothetical protein